MFDVDLAALESGYLRGGKRRILAVDSSLANASHAVDLGDAITGIDCDPLKQVLGSIAHVGRISLGLT